MTNPKFTMDSPGFSGPYGGDLKSLADHWESEAPWPDQVVSRRERNKYLRAKREARNERDREAREAQELRALERLRDEAFRVEMLVLEAEAQAEVELDPKTRVVLKELVLGLKHQGFFK